MSLQRRMGLGITFSVDTSLSTNYTALGNLVNTLKNSGTKADVADLSILSDTWKVFGKGQIDPGEYDMEFAYDPLDNASANANTCARLTTMHTATGVNAFTGSGSASNGFFGRGQKLAELVRGVSAQARSGAD